MRVGRNPLTSAQVSKRTPIVCGVITHLPNKYQQYHRDRWQVVALSLRSMLKHAGTDVHLAIWDNGSHKEFTDWLQDEFHPDTLVLSKNVGKSVARKSLFRMFEPNTIMAMADDDIFYYPNWLVAQIELLDHFGPQVGTVTGYAVRTMYRWANEYAKRWAETHGKLEVGQYVKAEWDKDYCDSIGRDYEQHKKTSTNIPEYKVIFNKKEALALGHHCQFICLNGRIEPLLRWDYDAMADEKPFDRAVDAKYMRLCTVERYTRHMGNVLDDNLFMLANRYGLSVTVDNAASSQPINGTVKGRANIEAAVVA